MQFAAGLGNLLVEKILHCVVPPYKDKYSWKKEKNAWAEIKIEQVIKDQVTFRRD